MAALQSAGLQAYAPACLPQRSRWRLSWPLVAAAIVYLYCLVDARGLLMDGDTLWHIAAGEWILRHQAIPVQDPFSHTMAGAAWTAHEWLAEVILAGAYQAGGFAGVVGVAAAAFALTAACLTRFLLRWFEPAYVLLFAVVAIKMASVHLLARPHLLAMPLLLLWVIELVNARCDARPPRLHLLAVLVLWANLHGSFTFALVLAAFFGLEAVVEASPAGRKAVALAWGRFVLLACAAALLTPHGWDGMFFTWKVLVDSSPALDLIGEWRSPDFHQAQPLEVWLLGLIGVALVQGIRLPVMRVVLLLLLVHLSLKHLRHVALLGLVSPVLLAPALAAHWEQRRATRAQLQVADRTLGRLSPPAGAAAWMLAVALLSLATVAAQRLRPFEPNVPAAAVLAARAAGATGPVLNTYDWGGYLIFSGIPPFIDGRADMYGNALLKEYVDAVAPASAADLHRVLDKYGIQWTLLEPRTAAIAALDLSPGWKRIHTDGQAVVHMRTLPATGAPLLSSR
jgi:hypothetical protein